MIFSTEVTGALVLVNSTIHLRHNPAETMFAGTTSTDIWNTALSRPLSETGDHCSTCAGMHIKRNTKSRSVS
jgi:hypothetical protein